MINTIRAMIARAAVRLAIAAAPDEQAERLRQVTRPIWTQGGGGPRPTVPK